MKFDFFFDATPLLCDHHALIKKAEEDGALYFPNLLNKDKVLNVRRQILELCNKSGWLDISKPLMEGIVKEGVKVVESPKEDWYNFYKQVICLKDFDTLAFDDKILSILKVLISDDVLPHCRKVCRLYSPMPSTYCTPPHRDYVWTGGTNDFWTVWTPFGELDFEMGGLEYIRGSHKMEFKFKGGHENNGIVIPENTVWTTAKFFNPGDVVMFKSNTVHSGRSNKSSNKIRISSDCRYQSASQPIRKDSLCNHWNEKFNLSWEEIYKDWPEDESSKYYWKKFANIVESSEGSYHQDIKKRFILHSIMHAFEKKD